MNIKEPTGDECDSNAKVYEDEHNQGFAIWYPQMGGYCGKAVAILNKQWEEHESGCRQGGCIEIYVWHDGEFPFSDGDGRNPVHLHHCDAMQFVDFGTTIERLNEQGRVEVTDAVPTPNVTAHAERSDSVKPLVR